jgi:hypothetical protein
MAAPSNLFFMWEKSFMTLAAGMYEVEATSVPTLIHTHPKTICCLVWRVNPTKKFMPQTGGVASNQDQDQDHTCGFLC